MKIFCKDKNGTDLVAFCDDDLTGKNPGGTIAAVYAKNANGDMQYCKDVIILRSDYKEPTWEKSVIRILEQKTFTPET